MNDLSVSPPAAAGRLLAVNLLFIDGSNLTGPGYYARHLFEELAILAGERRDFELIGYAQPAAERHFSAAAWRYMRPLRDLGKRIPRVLFEQFRLPGQARRDRVSILFSPAFVSPLWGAPHLVVGICDMYYRVVPEAVEGMQRQYWRAMIPLSARRCERIITISETSKRDIERYLPTVVGKTHAFRLASRFEPRDRTSAGGAAGDTPFVLMVANLTANKNIDVVVAAVAQLRRAGETVDFVQIGADHLGLLAQSISRHDAAGFVHALGKVSDADLVERFETCLCAVVPSLYEGFGMPVLEAQAFGAAMICSDRGAVPEVAGDGAILFDPEDPAALGDAIRRYLHDEPLRREMQSKARANVRKFSWRKTAEGTLSVFMDIWDRAGEGPWSRHRAVADA